MKIEDGDLVKTSSSSGFKFIARYHHTNLTYNDNGDVGTIGFLNKILCEKANKKRVWLYDVDNPRSMPSLCEDVDGLIYISLPGDTVAAKDGTEKLNKCFVIKNHSSVYHLLNGSDSFIFMANEVETVQCSMVLTERSLSALQAQK